MSLILEALRKREREKQVPERGFLVTAETAWAPDRGRSLWVVILAAVLAFGLGVAFVSLRPAGVSPSPSPAAATPMPAARAAAPVTLLPAATRPAAPAPAVASPAASVPAEEAPVPPPPTTLAAATPSPPAQALVLQAISERDGQPVALISDHLLREGDTFDGARILHIGEAEVEIELEGRRVTLRF